MAELLGQDSTEQFLIWEQASRDTIDVKRVYIDLAGDLVTGILLSQIIYWFLPGDGESKLRVEREGRVWLAKLRTDWWDECRISAKQFDRSIDILKEKGLVETKRFQFRGAIPTLHIWLNVDALVQGVKCILPKGQNGSSPKGKMEVDQRVKSSTESTNIDYLTEIKGVELEANFKSLLLSIAQLPYWGHGNLEEDVKWLVDFLAQYPATVEKDVTECRNRWDGVRASHRGIWKHRLANWMRIGAEIKAHPRVVNRFPKGSVYRLPDEEALRKKAEALGLKP